ncbi:hypothetical protein P9850_01965 [Anoxybacillus rupiensis]|uniref:DNA-binding protein n=1 Tax=Anoxybacteroides rupiense TaxID=311460 RepID=A0ABD5IRN4_9BACL|nr:hypothetical protein [Anoxybacillus rupiensis]
MDREQLRKYIDENLLTKQEAMEITGQRLQAFDQAVSTRRLKPFYDHGEGRSRVRLYLKSEVEEYARQVQERRNRLKNKK